MQLKKTIIFLVLCCFALFFFSIQQANAGVFRCVKANGEIEFRDKPCDTVGAEQSFLPYRYEKTISLVANKDSNKDKATRIVEKRINAENKKIEKKLETIARLEQKEHRLKECSQKKQEKEQKKAERLQLRCERIEEKIQSLERQLQQGKKLKTYKRLEAELEHAQLMKKRYCSHCLRSLS